MNPTPIVVEYTYDAPADRVWQAITDADQMRQWYFDLPDFKAQVGFAFQFTGGTETKQYLHLCEVTEVIPERKLSHTWRYDGYEGNSEVSWELFPEGDRTRVKLTHAGLERFPANPDFAADNFRMGWNDILGKSLKHFVEGTTAL
jgi:uncharacterized protein YndB with AHSA1/START domain